MIGSTITGNGRIGIATNVGGKASVKNSTIIDNDASPLCDPPTLLSCYDIGSVKRPRVRNTTCGESHDPNFNTGGGCTDWCVCAGDQP